MYEPTSGYHPSPGINGQGLPYHVSMTAGSPAAVSADKNSLLLSAATGVRQPVSHHGSVVHHQGNLQPGYLPRPVETSSLSCDSELAPSTGIRPSPPFSFPPVSPSNTFLSDPLTSWLLQGTQAKE